MLSGAAAGGLQAGSAKTGQKIVDSRGQTWTKQERGWMSETGQTASGVTAAPKSSGGGGGGGGGGPAGGFQIGPGPTIEFSLGQAPELKGLELPYDEFARRLSEVNQPEQLAGLAERYNAPTKQAFESYLPQFRSSLAALGGLAQDYLGGRIPTPVAQQIGRATAAANLQSGLGGGGLGRSLVARDLGKTSMELQQLGANLFGQSVGLAQQGMQMATPISVANLMVSPQTVFETAMKQAQYNQQMANANLINAWQSQPLPGQYVLGKGYQTFTPGQFSTTRPTNPNAGPAPTWTKGLVGSAAQGLYQQQLTGWNPARASSPSLVGV